MPFFPCQVQPEMSPPDFSEHEKTEEKKAGLEEAAD